MLSFSEKTGKHQTEIGVLLWVRLTKLKKAETMKAIMALQVCDWAAHGATIDYYTALPAGFLDNVSAGTSNGKNTLRLKSQKWGKNSQKVIKELNRKNWLTKND